MIPGAPIYGGASYRPLKGSEKVAALLLTMGKPAASRLLKHFDAIEIRQITRSAAELGSVSLDTVEALVEEFAEHFTGGQDLRSGVGEVRELLQGVLPPEQITDIMSEVLGSSNHVLWERISTMSETVLVTYLTDEHPQTAALILSKINAACAAKVMSLLPRDLRNGLMRRMVSLQAVAEPVLKLLEDKLHEDLLLAAARSGSGKPSTRIAEIINKMDREQTEDLLDSLAEDRPEDAAFLRGLVFNFEDIVKLTQRDRSVLMDKLPTERVVLALSGAGPEVRESILSSLGARARRLVENELNGGSAAPARDVAAARRMIADTVLDLAARGEIELAPAADAA